MQLPKLNRLISVTAPGKALGQELSARHPSGLSRKYLGAFDYFNVGESSLRQNQLIYTLVIISRIAAGYVRGMKSGGDTHEAREHAMRDVAGWLIWYYAMGIFERAFISSRYPKQLNALVGKRSAKATEAEAATKPSLFARIFGGETASIQQIANRKQHALDAINRQKKSLGKKEFAKAKAEIEHYYGKLSNSRLTTAFTGLMMTIGLLGIGINLLNIYLTKRSLARQHAEDNAAKAETRTQTPESTALKDASVTSTTLAQPTEALQPASTAPTQPVTPTPTIPSNPIQSPSVTPLFPQARPNNDDAAAMLQQFMSRHGFTGEPYTMEASSVNQRLIASRPPHPLQIIQSPNVAQRA